MFTRPVLLFVAFSVLVVSAVLAQKPTLGHYPPFTKWYQNPLGVSPVSLHTANGFYLPAIAAGAILLFTKKDAALNNRISIYEDLGVSYGYYASKTTVYQSNTGMLFRVRKYMSLGAEFSVAHVTDHLNNTVGFGIRPFVRFYPLSRPGFKVFFQSGAGLIYFLDTFPKPSGFFGDYREGTRLNGNPKYGAGVEFRITERLAATAGLWHIHFSNGNHLSDSRNPGHDSNGISLGLIYNRK